MHLSLRQIGLFTLGLCAIAWAGARAAEIVPIATTFTSNHLQGETSIWQLAEAKNGQIVGAGTRIGFYEDGKWEFLQEPRSLNFRCLFVDGDTLWVSSPNEIGRLRLPLNQQSRYEKIEIPSLETAGDIWYLARQGADLVATTQDTVWFIEPGKKDPPKQIKIPNSSRLILHSFEGKLIVTSDRSSPAEIVNRDLATLAMQLPDKRDTFWFGVSSTYIFSAPRIYKKELGAYSVVSTIKNSGDRYLHTSFAKWGNLLVVTTYNKGVLFVDLETGQLATVTHPAALPAQGTTHAIVDRFGRLWVATTRGVSVFEPLGVGSSTPTTAYPLSAYRTEGLLINFEDRAEYRPLSGPSEIRPRAFSLLNTTHGIASGFWQKIRIGTRETKLSGADVGVITELKDGNILAAAGDHFYHIDPRLKSPTLLTEPKGEISGLAVVGEYLWAATISSELHRSAPSYPFAFTKVATLPKNSATTLHRLGETLIIASTESVTFSERQIPVAHTAGIRSPRLATTADDTVWLLGEQQGLPRLGRLRQTGGTVSWETVEAKGLTLLSDVHHLSASGSTLTITAADRILELNTAELRPTYRLDPPRLAFAFTDPQTARVTTLPSPPPSLAAENSSLTFAGTLPFDEFGERPAYERRLLPTETTWTPTKAGERVSYPSLSPRDYTLEVRATHLGHTGRLATHPFTVLPPWYQTPYAIGGYVTLAALLAYFTYRLRTHQIRRRNLELERLVALRTRELAEASAAKSEFVASMSHEIRNPMNGVIGLVNILREQPALPRQSNTLRLLQDCAEQLRATVDDILDFSKIEARRVALENITFDLLTTLEAAAVSVDPAGTAIVFADKPPADLLLQGDAGKLRQIFANYLNNALKYGVPPGARVSTILTPGGPQRLRLTLSVTSTGPTIEKDKLDALFESFTRGDDAVERNIRGTGLGLAICKRYAQAMGGEVGAVSTNGETTFYLHVPFEKISASARIAPTVEVPETRSTLPARALAIEDEDYNRIVLGNILEKMNYTVDWATTGAEALHLAQENGYDIVLTDYRLPDTNGVELTKKILALCPDPKPAVFAVTAYSTRERRDECMGAGMSGFISKPITLEKLRATLHNWGDRQLTKISLEASLRPMTPKRRAEEIEAGWTVLKRIALTDPKVAADHAHRLNNLCRSLHEIDIAEQLELLEGALERGESTDQVVSAVDRLLRS
jgi:signal transduction histidine kinase/CheY-like chemotaxis protein